MAVTHSMFAAGLKNLINGSIGNIGSSATEALTLSLLTSDGHAAISLSTDEYWAEISANEISTAHNNSTDYAAKTIAGTSLGSSGNATLLLSSTDVVFTTTGSMKAYCGVTRASSYLLSFIDFDGEQESVDGTFRVNWATTGLIRFEVTT